MRFFKVEEIDEDTFTKQGVAMRVFLLVVLKEVRTEQYMRS